MNPPYSSLAFCYDRLNADADYAGRAAYLTGRMQRYGVPDGALVLDLACGTGAITLLLAAAGYDMIGIDRSPDMLAVARSKPNGADILWLCQDMRAFELYGTVSAVVCCLDSLNYLTGLAGMKKCLSLVHNYLDPGGLFLFDVNTPYKFRHVYGNEHYVLEAPGVFCGWKNRFDAKSGLCDFELTIFSEENGRWRRFDEHQRERCWSPKTLNALLDDAGFERLETTGDRNGRVPSETDERLYYVCRAVK